jgi:hypothetical protein
MRLLAPVIENPSFNAAVGNIRNVFLPMKPATWPISVCTIGLALITIVSVYFATETRTKAEA